MANHHPRHVVTASRLKSKPVQPHKFFKDQSCRRTTPLENRSAPLFRQRSRGGLLIRVTTAKVIRRPAKSGGGENRIRFAVHHRKGLRAALLYCLASLRSYRRLSIRLVQVRLPCCRTSVQPIRNWLRELDLNQRPSGYEPDELPTAPPRDPKNNRKYASNLPPGPEAVNDLCKLFEVGRREETCTPKARTF